jgi:hypothetical protein
MRVVALRRAATRRPKRFRKLLLTLAAPSFLTDFSNPRGERLIGARLLYDYNLRTFGEENANS